MSSAGGLDRNTTSTFGYVPHRPAVKARPEAPVSRPLAEFPPAGTLPDPAPLCANLALCVVEVLAGARSLDQVSRWVTDSVFVNLLRRSVIASRARAMAGADAPRPRLRVGDPLVTYPVPGVVEAVVLVHQPARTRAIAIRLETVRGRWRATAITVL